MRIFLLRREIQEEQVLQPKQDSRCRAVHLLHRVRLPYHVHLQRHVRLPCRVQLLHHVQLLRRVHLHHRVLRQRHVLHQGHPGPLPAGRVLLWRLRQGLLPQFRHRQTGTAHVRLQGSSVRLLRLQTAAVRLHVLQILPEMYLVLPCVRQFRHRAHLHVHLHRPQGLPLLLLALLDQDREAAADRNLWATVLQYVLTDRRQYALTAGLRFTGCILVTVNSCTTADRLISGRHTDIATDIG